MKRCLFIVLAFFGLNSFAGMHEKGSDHMSNMMGSESESGVMGSFSLRYKGMGFEEDSDDLTYRARVGWQGDVNEAVKWAVSLSTATEQNFGGLGLEGINLEQAYVHYMPMEGLSVRVGKSGWMPDFHKSGVLYSEQLYATGAMLKYHHMGWYAKAGLFNYGEDSSPLADGWTVKVKVGGHVEVSDGMNLGVNVSALHDGLMKEGEAEAQTLAKVGVNFGMSSIAVPVGASFNWLSNADEIGFNSYTAGLSVGAAGKADSTDMGDFGVAVNYYKLAENDFVGRWLNEDYLNVSGTGHEGVAVRAQYNPWDNTSLVAKYAHNLADDAGDDAGNLVAELMFVF